MQEGYGDEMIHCKGMTNKYLHDRKIHDMSTDQTHDISKVIYMFCISSYSCLDMHTVHILQYLKCI